MFSSKSLENPKFSLGGITMRFTFFKKKNLPNSYRRKPLYLFNNTLSNDLDYFMLFNKYI
jgi:hypothetical protein